MANENTNTNTNTNTNVEIWNAKAGEVTAVKIFGNVFNVKKDVKDVDVLSLANTFSEVFTLTTKVEAVKETPELPVKRGRGRPPKKVEPAIPKPMKSSHVRVPQSKSKDYTPILDAKGEPVNQNGIPLYEEFIKVIFDKFDVGQNFESKEVAMEFSKAFPDYSASTLKNKAVAYCRHLVETNEAVITKIDGVKREIALVEHDSATPQSILAKQEKSSPIAKSESASVLDGINA